MEIIIPILQHVWRLSKVKNVTSQYWNLEISFKASFLPPPPLGWCAGIYRWDPRHFKPALKGLSWHQAQLLHVPHLEGSCCTRQFPRHSANCLIIWEVNTNLCMIQCLLIEYAPIYHIMAMTIFPRKKCFWFTYMWLMHVVGFINKSLWHHYQKMPSNYIKKSPGQGAYQIE